MPAVDNLKALARRLRQRYIGARYAWLCPSARRIDGIMPNSIFAVNRRLVGFKPPSYATHDMWNADEWTIAG